MVTLVAYALSVLELRSTTQNTGSGDGGLVMDANVLSTRQLWAVFLSGIAVPLAFAGLLIAASYVLAVYVARLEMDIDSVADNDERLSWALSLPRCSRVAGARSLAERKREESTLSRRQTWRDVRSSVPRAQDGHERRNMRGRTEVRRWGRGARSVRRPCTPTPLGRVRRGATGSR